MACYSSHGGRMEVLLSEARAEILVFDFSVLEVDHSFSQFYLLCHTAKGTCSVCITIIPRFQEKCSELVHRAFLQILECIYGTSKAAI